MPPRKKKAIAAAKPRKFKGDINPDAIKNCFVFYGLSEIVSSYVDVVVKQRFGNQKIERVSLDCTDITPNDLIFTITGDDLFSSGKCYIVHNVASEHWESIKISIEQLGGLTSNTYCFIVNDKISVKDKVVALLASKGRSYDCSSLMSKYGELDGFKAQQLKKHAETIVSEQGIQFADPHYAVDYLVSACGYNLASIVQECYKLKIYFGDEVIPDAGLRSVVTQNFDISVFNIIKVLEAGKWSEALQMLYYLKDSDSFDIIELISLMLNRIRFLVHIKQYGQIGYEESILTQMHNDAGHIDSSLSDLVSYHPYSIKLALNSNLIVNCNLNILERFYDFIQGLHMEMRIHKMEPDIIIAKMISGLLLSCQANSVESLM